MTVLAKITLNESTNLDFGLEISGTDSKEMDIRFIIEGPDYGISCRCIENEGTITASIPKLNGVLPPGTYGARLEVLVDGKYFQPLTEDIEFVMPVSVGVSPKIGVRAEPIIRAKSVPVLPKMSVVSENTVEHKKEKLKEMAAKILEYEEALSNARKR
jgi:hypothetical protein